MSTKIFEVKQQLSKAQAEYRAIVTKEADLPTDETLADDDTSRLTVLEHDINVLKSRVDRLEALDSMDDVAEAEADAETDTDEKAMSTGLRTKQFQPIGDRPFARPQTNPIEKGIRAARFLIGSAYSVKNGTRAAANMISKTFGDDLVAKSILSVSSTGATTIPTYFSTDLIEILRPLIAVRAAGAATIDTSGGNLTIPRLATTATSQWQTENADILASNETFDTVVLSNHKLTSLVGVSNDLLRRSPLGLDSIVRDDLVAVMARAEDTAFLTSTGAGGSPIGLRAQTGIQSMFAAGFDLPSIVAAIVGAVTKLQMANTRMLRPAWIMSPMTKNFISAQRDSVGGFFVFKAELDQNMLAGYPVFTTTNLPSNLTNYATGSTGTHGSDVFLADLADVLIGDTMQIDMESSNSASYFDGTSLQSAFSKDMMLYRIIKETDLVLRHPTSVVQLKVDAWTLY